MAGAHALGVEVIDRCNLTVLQEPGQEGLVDFLAAHQVLLPATSAQSQAQGTPDCPLPQHLLLHARGSWCT